MERITVRRSIWINAPRERVWVAVTDPEQLGLWWTPSEWSIPEVAVGGRVTFGFGGDAALATITVLDPPREVTMVWEPNSLFPTTMTSTLLLEEADGGTLVTAIESGFEGLPDDIRPQRITGNEQGYEIVLQALKDLIEQPS